MKIFTGKVIATKSAKTATVSVGRVTVHPIYKKRFRRQTKYLVHDELGVKIGDSVKFVACRPYSKMKKWKITEVVNNKGKAKK
jgi:small subunit ribosomal protein S17